MVTNLLFFEILLLYYYINFRSLIICSLIPGGIYFSLDILSLFITVSESFCGEGFWNFCDFISNSVTNQITGYFCAFLNCSFWSSFKCTCSRLFSSIKKFLALLTTSVFTYILPIFLLTYLAKDKNPHPFTNVWFLALI